MKNVVIALFLAVSLLAAPAWAAQFTINDTWNDWPGYNSPISGTDELGTPQIDFMDVFLDDSGLLEKVDIVLKRTANNQWQEFNSLFINSYEIDTWTTQWDDWDYFVHDGGNSNKTGVQGSVPGDGIYTVDPGGYSYTMTRNKNSVRQDTPNGIAKNDLTFLTANTGWSNVVDHYIYSYNFEGLGIDLSEGGFIAFAQFCGNDVIGGEINPVPEPTTMALLGIGILGLAGVARQRYRH